MVDIARVGGGAGDIEGAGAILGDRVGGGGFVGGELEMRFVNGNNYLFNLIMYFDAANGTPAAIDPTVTINILN